jgi:hypothetical protein
LILEQVENGVPARMAVLYWLLVGGQAAEPGEAIHADAS